MIILINLNSYSTHANITINKLFNMYIVDKKAIRRFLCKTSHPKRFETTNFDRFFREAIGVRRFNKVLNYAMIIDVSGTFPSTNL